MLSLIDLATKLIQCPSLTPDDAGCQPMIADYLTPLGFHCEAMRFDDVDNLFARYGKNAPLLVFAGHTDVVPTGPLTEWKYPPFAAQIDHEYLYGRGASDMKAAIAAMLFAVNKFLSNTPQFNGSIGFLITSDEEGAAINGTRKVIELLQKRGEKIDYCIIGEPSSDHQIGDQIRVGRRGSLHGKLLVRGKQGHVAHPHLAINPIHISLMALHELAQKEWDQGNEHFPKTTFQITNIHSGTGASNVIPGVLEVLFNFRFSTAVTVDQLQKETHAILHKYGLNFEVYWHIGGEPFLTKSGKLIAATQKCIKEIAGLDVNLSTGGGTSDGRFIAPTGTEVLELGVSHATAHQIDECVKIADLEVLADIYHAILTQLLR